VTSMRKTVTRNVGAFKDFALELDNYILRNDFKNAVGRIKLSG